MKPLKFSRLFRYTVLAPMLLGAVYFAAIKDSLYDSESLVVLRSIGQEGRAGGIGQILGMEAPLKTDALNLRAFMLSSDMVSHLEKNVGLSKEWGRADGSWDFATRMWSASPSKEELGRYYDRRVGVEVDERSGLLSVKTSSFSPAHAQAVTQELLAYSNVYVNKVNAQLAKQDLDFLEKEVQAFYARLTDARGRLEEFQAKNGLLDAEASAQAQSVLISKLEADEAATSAELAQAQTYLAADSYGVSSLRNKAVALKAELERQRKKATAPGMRGDKALQYRELKAEAMFLEDAYRRTKASAEQARLEASRQARQLVVVQTPGLPQSPRHLERAAGFGLWAFLLLATYAVTRVVLTVFRERPST